MEIIKFLDWEFNVDKEETTAGYQKALAGGSNFCKCTMCENFVASRNTIYPDTIKKLFNDLGIDYKKEAETYHMTKLDNGLHYYGGWFHFIGQIIKGKDMKIPAGSNGYTLESIEITNNFHISFLPGSSLSFLDKEKYHLIQVEFFTSIPWVIEKEKEPN